MYLFRLRSAVSSVLLLFVLAFTFSTAHAVDVNGRIKGTVTDPSGAVIPNADVTATNLATGVKYPTKSNATGDYLFPQLPVGTYSISVSASGFKTFAATGIVLQIDQEYVQGVKMEVGNRSETLEVAADAVQVNTTDMQLNNVVNSQQMVELPLINRNFSGLELIQPGVQASSDRFGTFSVSGAETQQSEFLVNGADSNDLALNTLVITPNLDAIDQFNLIEGPLNAEYDRNSGGIVSATIKQGSNHFHGDAFEFYRDTFLNTGNYFSYIAATPTKPAYKNVTPYHQNIFGGTLGGPIFRDKLFAFGAYQGTRQRVPGSGGSTTIFSPAQRTGDFSGDLGAGSSLGYKFNLTNKIPSTLKIPSCGAAAVTWGDCIANNGGKFTTADFNPISTKLLSTYVPSQPNSGTNTYIFNSVNTTSNDQYIGRFDYSLNPRNQFTFLGIYFKQAVNSVIPFTGASLPGFSEVDAQHTQQYTFDYVRQMSTTLVNDFAAHYTRFNYAAVYPAATIDPSTFGFDIHPQLTQGESLPLISTGYFSLGFSNNGPQPRIDQVYQLDDNVSKSWGHHALKFGYDGRRFGVSNPFGANNNGNFGFSSGGTYSTGDPGLDFLLGNPNTYSQGSGAQIIASAHLNYMYGQDTWKLSDSLTLSYGMGYQIDTVLHNRQYGGEAVICFIPGQQSKVFPTAPKNISYPGDPGCTDASQAYTRFSGFGPRIGFAWSPDLGWISNGNSHKFAVRGGFGIYYNRSEEETSLNNLQTPPFGLGSGGIADYTGGSPTFAKPYTDINTGEADANKFPYKFPNKGDNIDFSLYTPLDVSLYAPGFRSPYAENFQLSVERELPARIVTRLTYVASLGRHNQNTYEGNPITQAGHDACLADTAKCGSKTTTGYRNSQPYYFPSHTLYPPTVDENGTPAYTSMGYVTSEASSNYNALQVSVQKAPTHGLSFQVSYTYAHAMDTSSSYEGSGYGGSNGRGYNEVVPGLNYGDSGFDSRNRIVIAPIYITPQFHGSNWYSPLNLALSGWEISGITTMSQGFPFDVSYGGGSANSLWCSPNYYYYACPDEPNIVGPLQRANPRTKLSNGRTAWYTANTTSPTFMQAPLGTFGTAHRNPFHGPGINNTNLILAKNLYLNSDRNMYIQLRMESDNVFNHTQFSNPGSSFSSTAAGPTATNPTGLTLGSAGQISSAASARLTQLAAKFYF